jgi:hypothetical protein
MNYEIEKKKELYERIQKNSNEKKGDKNKK